MENKKQIDGRNWHARLWSARFRGSSNSISCRLFMRPVDFIRGNLLFAREMKSEKRCATMCSREIDDPRSVINWRIGAADKQRNYSVSPLSSQWNQYPAALSIPLLFPFYLPLLSPLPLRFLFLRGLKKYNITRALYRGSSALALLYFKSTKFLRRSLVPRTTLYNLVNVNRLKFFFI